MSKTGILITHGTDTMAWTHAFLRYAIKKNTSNIVITGSQIPLPGMGDFSDAYVNIGNSIRFLSQMTPPNIITVFNYGVDAFLDSLHKINRWDNIAFTGDRVARMEWDEVKALDENIEFDIPQPLDKLFLITTGGTIESTFNEEGVLVPSENHLMGFIGSKFSTFFKQVAQKPAFVIDSSDLTFERMFQIADKVAECNNENKQEKITYIDTKFSQNVKVLYTDPLKKLKDYQFEVNDAEAVVIAGYGGGNINIDPYSNQNLISLIKEMTKKHIPVVLTSQVPLGPADFIYKNAWEAIKTGAISGADLSIPEIQIRLSYLVGHKDDIIKASAKMDIEYMRILEWLFMSGMKFRTQKSKRMYEKFKNMKIDNRDLLINMSFQESLDKFYQTH
jgi:L-asparaginase/Glu-tRNA(Gln) amidotransferase subunit D